MTTDEAGNGNKPTERTGLLSGNGNGSNNNNNNSTGNYSSGASPALVAVVDIPQATSEGAPVVPAYLLTKTVRKVIKQHYKAEAYIKIQQEQQIRIQQQRQQQQVEHRPSVVLKKKRPGAVRRGSNTSSSSSSDSDSSSSSSSDGETSKSTKSLRKRDIIKNALRSATDQWKDEHGWSGSTSSLIRQHTFHGSSSSSSALPTVPTTEHHKKQKEQETEDGDEEAQVPTPSAETQQPLPPLPVNPAQRLTLPPIEHDVWQVAKHASVCALLAMTKRDNTEKLALTTLEYGMKESSATPLVLRELLLRPWLDNRSALEWAVVNDCQVFLSNARVQSVVADAWKFYGPTDWQDVPDHPFAVWNCFSSNPLVDYLARWAAPRYQALVGLVCGLVYLGLHFSTVANRDYTNYHPYDFEYAYYFFVVSDLVLELYKLLLQPVQAVKRPSTYLSLVTAGFLFTSFVLRLVALCGSCSLGKKQALLIASYNFIVWATPLMVFRVVLWTDNLCWQVAKARHLVSQCIVDALWVVCLGVVTILAFWVGLAALQHEDVDCLTMLRHLALGALHSPEINATLYYQPLAAGVMLFVYLFLITVVIGTLLTASFLTTMLTVYPRIESVRRLFFASRCAKKPVLGVFSTNVVFELIVGFFVLFAVYLLKAKKDSASLQWVERLRQILWFTVFSPLVLVVGIVEGVYYLAVLGRHRLQGYHILR
ncbi:hypothetical protein BDB00DRAFT_931503 [Zychaea mexicana]|uniref:uncharacterized protein n=1 Tax=Zychaea mexicana TaxID=64656 RepID=UPI0022FE0309|nr:uncharacterized protein BDB00DRAFT_931503 [Zychaea mexicana]KAI9490101.1 hypothetical protein BDB00DRAFT_931503 [Zychaea mexicana]